MNTTENFPESDKAHQLAGAPDPADELILSEVLGHRYQEWERRSFCRRPIQPLHGSVSAEAPSRGTRVNHCPFMYMENSLGTRGLALPDV